MKITQRNREAFEDLYNTYNKSYKWTIDYIIYHLRTDNNFKIRKPYYEE